jgi:hypothetical protein
MPKRHIMQIELSASAKRNVAALGDYHGMTQLAMMSRLVEWFAAQDAWMQLAILSRLPTEEKPDTAKMVLERMAGLSDAKPKS